MKYTRITLVLFATLLLCAPARMMAQNYTQYVNPFVGTDAHGHTFPGALVPFGAVQLSPDTRLSGWDGCSGYHYSDDVVYGFSHTHLSGTGCSDYGDILVMPFSGEGSPVNTRYCSKFSHQHETASPGYYSVQLETPNVLAELTATTHVGCHRYTFANDGQPHGIVIDLDKGIDAVRAELTKYPVSTRVNLKGTIIVARDIAHAKLKARLDAGEEMPAYFKWRMSIHLSKVCVPNARIGIWGKRWVKTIHFPLCINNPAFKEKCGPCGRQT